MGENPPIDFFKRNLVGKSLTLVSIHFYGAGQSELLDLGKDQTVQHLILFSADGKISEDGKDAGSWNVEGEMISINYQCNG